MTVVGLDRNATNNLPISENRNSNTRDWSTLAALALALATLSIAWGATSARAAEVICSGTGLPLDTPHTQIVFDSISKTCEISDAGPAPAYGLRAFLLPGFSTPTALGQKLEKEAALLPDAYTTNWTNAKPSDGPHARGFASKDLGTFEATLTGDVDGTTYTMEVTFTVANGATMTVDSAQVSFTPGNRVVFTGSVAPPATQ